MHNVRRVSKLEFQLRRGEIAQKTMITFIRCLSQQKRLFFIPYFDFDKFKMRIKDSDFLTLTLTQ